MGQVGVQVPGPSPRAGSGPERCLVEADQPEGPLAAPEQHRPAVRPEQQAVTLIPLHGPGPRPSSPPAGCTRGSPEKGRSEDGVPGGAAPASSVNPARVGAAGPG